jgi:hypothetical protein
MTTENFNIDSLLDGTLDDLADLPEFKAYPEGTHKVIISFALKEINKSPAYELSMKALETLELSNPADAPLEQGASTSVAYMLNNELGQGKFKKILASLAAHYGAKTNRELIDDAQNAEAVIVTKQRKDKKDPTRVYTDIVELAIV